MSMTTDKFNASNILIQSHISKNIFNGLEPICSINSAFRRQPSGTSFQFDGIKNFAVFSPGKEFKNETYYQLKETCKSYPAQNLPFLEYNNFQDNLIPKYEEEAPKKCYYKQIVTIKDILKEEKNEENLENKIEGKNIIKTEETDKNINAKPCEESKNMNLPQNQNTVTKFFTNHNYGYKCNCSKTQCNRKYCECYNSGNYCVDCNCKNCNNKPPSNTFSNKRPLEVIAQMKKSKEICTCSKSGCNKNYCECFKSGNFCTSLCRCIKCENLGDKESKIVKAIYEPHHANSIYIIKNKIKFDGLQKEKKNNKMINKKKKREDEEEKNYLESEEVKSKSTNDFTFLGESLFDKNGKVALKHINLIEYC